MAHQLIKYLRKHVEKKQQHWKPSVIMYGNRKQDPIILDATTFEKWQQCFVWLFHFLKDNWECYGELAEADPSEVPAGEDPGMLVEPKIDKDLQYQQKLYRAACQDDWAAAYELLHSREDWEYEHWDEVHLTDPTKK